MIRDENRFFVRKCDKAKACPRSTKSGSLNALWILDGSHFRRFAPACGFEPQKRIPLLVKML